MSDGPVGQPQPVPRPVDAAIGAEWRAFLAGGGVFSLPVATKANQQKRRNNAVLLAVLALFPAAALGMGAVLFLTEAGRTPTYVILGVLFLVAGFAIARIAGIRRSLNAVRDSPQEYVAVSRDGMRFAGVELPWTAIVGGLIIDERGVEYAGRKRLTAKIMLAAGHPRMEMLVGMQPDVVRDYRAQVPGAVRRVFFVSMGSGGPRIPLEHALDDDSINAFATAARVSAADADVPIIVSTDPAIIHTTIMSIWGGGGTATGKRPHP